MDMLLALMFLVGAILIALLVLGIAVVVALKIPILIAMTVYFITKLYKKFKK